MSIFLIKKQLLTHSFTHLLIEMRTYLSTYMKFGIHQYLHIKYPYLIKGQGGPQ